MTDQVLKLEKAPGFLRKISINVLNKDADYTLFTLPIEGVPLSEQQLDAFLGQYTYRSWYEQRSDGSWHPMPFWSKRDKGNFEVDGKLVSERVTVTVEGTGYLFEEYCVDEEADEEEPEGEMRPAARISSVKLTPMAGGTTLLSFHMQVRAVAGKARDALLDHMFRHIAITCDTELAKQQKPKQSGLPLVVEDQTGHQSPPPIVSKGGDAIDAEMRARHPEASAEVMGADAQPDPYLEGIMQRQGADGHPDPDVNSPSTEAEAHSEGGGIPADDPATDLAKFEEGAAQRLKDFTSVSETGAIDGTTPKSRRRGRREDTAH